MDVPEVASHQMGVFTRRQAYLQGWTPRQVRRRLAAGRWTQVAGAALAASDQQVDGWALAWSVVLTWPGAVVSHELAGALRGFPIEPPTVGTATVSPQRGVSAAGLRGHRAVLEPREVRTMRGLPFTNPQRTAIDLLALSRWEEARSLWAWLSTRDVLVVADLRAAVQVRARWSGTPQLRRLASVAATGALSPAEDRLHALLRRACVRGWAANARVVVAGRTVAVADVLFEREHLVVEVDGFATHSGRAAFQRDRRQQNALVAAGYLVLRFTWADLTDRPEEVVAEIRQALTLRSSGPR